MRGFAVGVAAVALCAATGAVAQERFARIDLPAGFAERPANFDDPAMPREDAYAVSRSLARETSAEGYWNRPGATWGALMQDWYACTVIAAVSLDDRGRYTYAESPTLVSPMERGIGTTIGGYGTRASDALPRVNRETCLRVRGWRWATPTSEQAREIRAVSLDPGSDWWNDEVGSETPIGALAGSATTRLPDDPALQPDGPVGGNRAVEANGAARNLRLGAGKGVLVMAFRRPDSGSRRQRAAIALKRYELDVRQLTSLVPEKAGGGSDSVLLRSGNRNLDYEVHAIVVDAGIYVIDGTSVNGELPTETNCFGAPMIEVPAGGAVYAGDWVPYFDVALAGGGRGPDALVMTFQIDDARATLATEAPRLAEALQPAALANGATYMCADAEAEMGRFTLSLAADQPDAADD